MYKIDLPEPLEREKENDYLKRASEGDLDAKNKIIEHNLRLVFYIANKYKNTGIEPEDLYSIGTIGLIKAVNTFEPSKNVKFATYSSRCIDNEILMYLRQNKKRNKDVSFDQSLTTDKEGKELSISDTLGSDKEEVEDDLMKKTSINLVKSILERLPEIEKKIIQFRFGIECKKKNQHDIANVLNISQSYVSRIEKKILDKIKREYEKVVV